MAPEGWPMIITVRSVVEADRHGAGAVAKSSHLICKLQVRKSKCGHGPLELRAYSE